MVHVFSATCGAFRIKSLNMLLSLTLYSKNNWILIHTALYASVRIPVSTIIILPLLYLEIHNNTTQQKPVPNDTEVSPTANALKEIFTSVEK